MRLFDKLKVFLKLFDNFYFKTVKNIFETIFYDVFLKLLFFDMDGYNSTGVQNTVADLPGKLKFKIIFAFLLF